MQRSTAWLTGLTVAGLAAAAQADPVALDLSSAMNFDAVGTAAEIDAAEAWYDNQGYDGSEGLDDYSKALYAAFGDGGAGEWYRGQGHQFANQYHQNAYVHDPTDPTTLQQTVTTGYGTYQLGPFDTGTFDTSTIGPMPGAANAIRLGTNRGQNGSAEGALATVSVTLPTAQQLQYGTLNLLVSGQAKNETTKRAWFRVYADYLDGSQELVFESPEKFLYDGDNASADPARNLVAGGVPIAQKVNGFALSDTQAAVWSEAVSVTRLLGTVGSGSAFDNEESSNIRTDANQPMVMWEIDGGFAVDPDKVLVGLTFELDNGPNNWWSGYTEGDSVNIYAAAGTAVPEPASLALLGLGALAMLPRRGRG